MHKINKIIAVSVLVIGFISLDAVCKKSCAPSQKKHAKISEVTSCKALYQRVGEALRKRSNNVLPQAYIGAKNTICCKGPVARKAWINLYHLLSNKTILERNVAAQIARYLSCTYGVVMEPKAKPIARLPKEKRGSNDSMGIDSSCARDFAAVNVAISIYLVNFEQLKRSLGVYTALNSSAESSVAARKKAALAINDAWQKYQSSVAQLNDFFTLMKIDNHFVVDEYYKTLVESALTLEGL